MAPFVMATLRSVATGELEAGVDGRYSAGSLDISAFLALPATADAVDKVLARRQAANVAAGRPAGGRATHLPFITQVCARTAKGYHHKTPKH